VTKEEALEKYGRVQLHFDSYYKYFFTFRGLAYDGAVIVYSFGGDADDIYRCQVSADKPVTMADDDYSALRISKDGELIYEETYY
jgi:hypothetical protein